MLHSLARDADAVRRVTTRFIELQGAQLVGGLVFREFVSLEPLRVHSKSKMPLTREFRVFVRDGRPWLSAPYWEEGDYRDEAIESALFASECATIDSHFFTMDVARRTDGRWIIMELGDGQVAGLPDALAPSASTEPSPADERRAAVTPHPWVAATPWSPRGCCTPLRRPAAGRRRLRASESARRRSRERPRVRARRTDARARRTRVVKHRDPDFRPVTERDRSVKRQHLQRAKRAALVDLARERSGLCDLEPAPRRRRPLQARWQRAAHRDHLFAQHRIGGRRLPDRRDEQATFAQDARGFAPPRAAIGEQEDPEAREHRVERLVCVPERLAVLHFGRELRAARAEGASAALGEREHPLGPIAGHDRVRAAASERALERADRERAGAAARRRAASRLRASAGRRRAAWLRRRSP
jgi:hypothetical protein